MTIEKYNGCSFNSLACALAYMYFGPTWPTKLDADGNYSVMKYIIPMKQDFENPIQPGTKDTFIQYFISLDEALTQSQLGYNTELNFNKLATCNVRFIGAQAESWAKAWHHRTKRDDVQNIFADCCNGRLLESDSGIRPTVVFNFGKNAEIAFDLTFYVSYIESCDVDWTELTGVDLGEGGIN